MDIRNLIQKLQPGDVHNERFAQSIEYLLQHCHPDKIRHIYEVGGKTNFTTVLQKYYPGSTIHHGEGDIRKHVNCDEKVDLVVCMEVVEHLSDIDSSDIGTLATYTGSGIKGFLQNLRGLLHEESYVFITTPNVCNYQCIWNVLSGAHPFAYYPHHREMTVKCLTDTLQQCNFGIQHVCTKVVWNNHRLHREAIGALVQLMNRYRISTENRGDDIFCIARKM